MKEKEKPAWLQRAISTYNYHALQCKNDPKWTLAKTAKKTGRAIGPISEDIRVAEYYKVYPDKILSFQYMIEAIDYVKSKKNSVDLIED